MQLIFRDYVVPLFVTFLIDDEFYPMRSCVCNIYISTPVIRFLCRRGIKFHNRSLVAVKKGR